MTTLKPTQREEELSGPIHAALEGEHFLKQGDSEEDAVVDTSSRLVTMVGIPGNDVHTRNVTILLSDIRGFSEIVESYSGRDVICMLNRYFDSMGELISQYRGSINKLMGDSILAIFGMSEERPDDVENALACAIEMQLAMTEVNTVNQSLNMPDLYMGIALNTGEVVAGELGSSHFREYTIIGDEVNLTSRIEAHCLRGQILISENTYRKAKSFIKVGEPNTIELKGVRKAVDLYELYTTSKPRSLQAPRRERRNSPRIKVSMPVNFQNLNGKIVLAERHHGDVVDISYHGLLIQTRSKLASSTEIKMSLSIELFGDRAADIYARIIKTTEKDGEFFSSLEFTTISSEALITIKQYVDQLVELL